MSKIESGALDATRTVQDAGNRDKSTDLSVQANDLLRSRVDGTGSNPDKQQVIKQFDQENPCTIFDQKIFDPLGRGYTGSIDKLSRQRHLEALPAENAFDARIDQDPNLSTEDRAIVKLLEHGILEHNVTMIQDALKQLNEQPGDKIQRDPPIGGELGALLDKERRLSRLTDEVKKDLGVRLGATDENGIVGLYSTVDTGDVATQTTIMPTGDPKAESFTMVRGIPTRRAQADPAKELEALRGKALDRFDKRYLYIKPIVIWN